MTYHVVIPKDITEPGKAYLTDHGCRITVGNGALDKDSLRALIADADGILARTGAFTGDVLCAAERLKVIGRHGVGTDGFDLDYCREHGVRFVNAPGSNAESVAEHTLGQMVALTHRFSAMDGIVRRGAWGEIPSLVTYDLFGKTLGIVGVGAIGALVAKKAMAAFSMRCVGYNPRTPKGGLPTGMILVKDLETLFAESDVVSLHLPLKAETRGLIDGSLIDRLKTGSYFVNNARGGVLDEGALVSALTEGRLAGAALDVYATEPLPLSSALLTAPNLLLTPHTAALTRESMDAMGLMAAEGIVDVLMGREPKHPVV